MKIILTMIIGLLVTTIGLKSVYCEEMRQKSQAQSLNTEDDSTSVRIKTKSPTGALLRSLAFPGWGQFYNEQYIKSALVFTGQSTLIVLSFYYNDKAKSSEAGSADEAYYKDQRNLMYWLVGAVVVLSMLDAYIDAHLYDFDAGPDLSMRVGMTKMPVPGQMGLFSIRARF